MQRLAFFAVLLLVLVLLVAHISAVERRGPSFTVGAGEPRLISDCLERA